MTAKSNTPGTGQESIDTERALSEALAVLVDERRREVSEEARAVAESLREGEGPREEHVRRLRRVADGLTEVTERMARSTPGVEARR